MDESATQQPDDPSPQRSGPSIGAAAAWCWCLSILLGWIPFLGPLIAGFVGGRKAGSAPVGLGIALIPAAAWGIALYMISGREMKIADQYIVVGPLAYLAPVTATAILCGALIGSGVGTARILGGVGLAIAMIWIVPRVQDVWKIASDVLAATKGHKEVVKDNTCGDNLSKLFTAAQFYSESWDGHLPPAEHWMTAIKDNVSKDEWLRCPLVSHGGGPKYGYSMNPALGGKSLKDLKDKAKMPVFFDSTDLTIDAHVGIDDLPKPGRHSGKNNAVFADGHVGNL